MSANHSSEEQAALRDYDRDMLKSAFQSLIYGVYLHRKTSDGLTLTELAKRLGKNKSELSKWFNNLPNWQLETLADLAAELEVELIVAAKDRKTGLVFTETGPQRQFMGVGRNDSAPRQVYGDGDRQKAWLLHQRISSKTYNDV